MSPAPVLNEDFRDLLELFAEHGVRFLVVGAHALAVHGVSRATGDLDVLVDPEEQNARRVMAALAEFGAPLGRHGVGLAELASPGWVYQMGLPPRRIDVLNEVSGLTFEEAWQGRLMVELDGLQLPVLGRQQFVRNKQASGRPKGLLDLQLLAAAKGSGNTEA